MNQITDPDELSYKQARNRLGKLAPVVLIGDIIIGTLIWLFRGEIFDEPQADYLGTLIAVCLFVAGIFSYFILKAMAKRVVRSKPLNNEDKKDL